MKQYCAQANTPPGCSLVFPTNSLATVTDRTPRHNGFFGTVPLIRLDASAFTFECSGAQEICRLHVQIRTGISRLSKVSLAQNESTSSGRSTRFKCCRGDRERYL